MTQHSMKIKTCLKIALGMESECAEKERSQIAEIAFPERATSTAASQKSRERLFPSSETSFLPTPAPQKGVVRCGSNRRHWREFGLDFVGHRHNRYCFWPTNGNGAKHSAADIYRQQHQLRPPRPIHNCGQRNPLRIGTEHHAIQPSHRPCPTQ